MHKTLFCPLHKQKTITWGNCWNDMVLRLSSQLCPTQSNPKTHISELFQFNLYTAASETFPLVYFILFIQLKNKCLRCMMSYMHMGLLPHMSLPSQSSICYAASSIRWQNIKKTKITKGLTIPSVSFCLGRFSSACSRFSIL